MKRWKAIAAVLLLGLWAACSVNCARANLSGADSLACCSDEGGDSDQAPASSSHCSCSVMVSGAYVPHSQVWPAALPADVVLSSFALCNSDFPSLPASPIRADASPPELAGSWQFLVRTALPARAP